MDYKSSIVIFLEMTKGFLDPPTPLGGFEEKNSKVLFSKVNKNIKWLTLITNTAIAVRCIFSSSI